MSKIYCKEKVRLEDKMKYESVISNADRRLVIIGVGGAGGNAVNRMVEDGVDGVEYISANTDNQALNSSLADNKIQLGEKLTGGTGAGARPEVGRKSAEESYDKIKEEIQGTDMLFIAAGMGGGTGTGAAPVIAQIGKEINALTVGIVTMPFRFEGAKKKEVAENGLEELKKYLDAIIVIPNDKILEISPKGTTLKEAFAKGNEVLKKGVKGIVDIIKKEGMVNIDFADVSTVIKNDGVCNVCHMGFGVSKGENRAVDSVKMAVTSPLLETSIRKAKRVLVNITSTMDSATISDLELIGDFINDTVGENENYQAEHNIIGYTFSDDMGDDLSVVVIATGIEDYQKEEETQKLGSNMSEKIQRRFPDDPKKNIRHLFNTSDISSEIEEIEEVKAKDKKEPPLDIPDFLRNNKKR